MSYTPTNWQTGDVVAAERLNKLEGGVADASNLFAGGSSIVVDGTEYQNVNVLFEESPHTYFGFITDGDITKIIGLRDEFDGFFTYSLLDGFRIATVTGLSFSIVPSDTVTIVGESLALVPRDSNNSPIIFPSSTQFAKGTAK